MAAYIAVLVIVLGVALLLWRLHRFTIYPALHPEEPSEFPYWIPFLGHLFGFFGDSNSLLLRAKKLLGNTGEPFALTVLGMTTYVLTRAEDVAAVYRNNDTFSYEEFVQSMMKILGNSNSCVRDMFEPLPKNKQGFPNPQGKCLGILFRDMHIHQVFPGHHLRGLERRFARFFDANLSLNRLTGMNYASLQDKSSLGGSVVVPLVKWCSDYFTRAGQDAYFGPKLAEIGPSLADDFLIFDELSYQVIFQYPSAFAREMLAAKGRILVIFEHYLRLSADERRGDSWFVKASEAEMRELGLSAHDMAIAIMTIYWAINTNSRKAGYWLLAHLMQEPSRIDIVRRETAPAFEGPDARIDVEYLHKSVPQLDAMWAETLRLSAFSASVRFITADTIIGGKTLRRGNRLIMPFRQLHMAEAVFGADASSFRHERFLENTRLAQSNHFRPFGGGCTACPGRHIAKRAVFLFVAMVLRRFDIEPMPGQKPIVADLTKPVPGLMSPKAGQDMLVRLTPRGNRKNLAT